MQNWMFSDVIISTWQSVYMVFISSFIAIFFGLIIGILLFFSAKSNTLLAQIFNKTLGLIVNATRSIPYIILMIILIPVTIFLMGTSIGTNASIIPLSIAAIPFFARISESAFSEVDKGLLEVAKVIGANKWQITYKILIPEARSSLISGATLTIISLVGYSAMAGAIGGGGLGTLAIQYGYQRFNLLVMIETVVILIIMVQFIQSFGNYLTKVKSYSSLYILSSVLFISSCGHIAIEYFENNHKDFIKVGVMSGISTDIMKVAKKNAKDKYNLDLKIVSFDDYSLVNRALSTNDIQANIFQHIPFLDSEIKNQHYNLISVGKTFLYPMGIFSDKYKKLLEMPNGSKVAIPSDPTNEGRALMLLDNAGLITLKNNSEQWQSTVHDILKNPKHLKIIPMDAAQIPNILNQVAIGAITNDYIDLAKNKYGKSLTLKDAIYVENKSSPFANIIVIRKSEKSEKWVDKLVQSMHQKDVVKITEKYFPYGGAIKAW